MDRTTTTTQEQVNVLIARRVPPGDRWTLLEPAGSPVTGKVIDGLVDTLDEYMQATGYVGDYRLAPRENGGLLYLIQTVEIELPIKPPKRYDLYGEF